MIQIPLSAPDIRQEDIDAMVSVLKSGMLVQSANVALLEENIASYIKAGQVVAVSNGTATMHMALLALGIGSGDEVIVPAFSYVATANVVELTGATPVFVDIEADTFNIDATKLEACITNKTKAIIPVHEFGLACDIESVMRIANKHQIYVIEDAACALGATQNGKFTGTFGAFGSFSLHPRKAITSGEGGLLAVSDKTMSEKVRCLRNHGIEIQNEKMEFIEAGFNYRMTDFQAALVNSQLKRLPSIIEYKNVLAQIYMNEVSHPGIKLPVVPGDRNHTWQTFHVLLNEDMNRDMAIQYLKAKGIGSNYGAQCIPMQKYYQKKYGLNCEQQYPNSVRAYRFGLAIPIYEKLTKDQVAFVAETLNRMN